MSRHGIVRGALITVAAALAAATAFFAAADGKGDSSGRTVTSDAASRVRWKELPPLPHRFDFDVDGAQVLAVDGELFVAIDDRSALTRRLSRIWVYRLAHGHWKGPVGRRSIPVNRGGRFGFVAFRVPCLVTPIRRVVAVMCLRHGAWAQLGPPTFRTTGSSYVTNFDGAFSTSAGILVFRAHLEKPSVHGAGVTGRLQHQAYQFVRGAWVQLGGADIDPSAPNGTQRPFAFSWNGRWCVAYDRLPADRATPPDMNLRCIGPQGWVDAAPALTAAMSKVALRETARGSFAVSTDGAVATGRTAYVGIDVFNGPRTDWALGTLHDGNWTVRSIGAGHGWNSQGSLFDIDGQVWAIRFDQRPSRSGLATRLAVVTIGAGVTQVGKPLESSPRFFGPLYYGLAKVDGRVYAMATVAIPHRRRDEVRVFQLTS